MNRLGLSLALTLWVSTAWSQDEPPELPAPAGIGRIVIGSADGEGGGVEFQAFSFDPGQSLILPALATGMSGSAGLLDMLHQEQVRRELELVDDQISAIREVQRTIQKKQQEASRQVFRNGQLDRLAVAELRERMAALQEEAEAALKKTLLPHQFDRLRQVSLHSRLHSAGVAATLGSKALAEELGITPEQLARLQQRAQEAQQKLERDIEKLKENARQDVLSELTPAQRDKLKDLLGEPYRAEPRSFPSQLLKKAGLGGGALAPKIRVRQPQDEK